MQSAYLSCKDIAILTGRNIRTVWGWCKSGKLKACRPGGKTYLIKREDFEAFMSADNQSAALS